MRNNLLMSENTKKSMADRLSYLMSKTPSMDTIEKVAARAKVSFGTVRRILRGDPTDPQIGKIECVANAFGLSIAEFVSDFEENAEITPDERQTIRNLRVLSQEDQDAKKKDIAKTAMLTIAAGRGLLIQQSQVDQSRAV